MLSQLIPIKEYFNDSNKERFNQELIDEVNMLAELTEKYALTRSHPNYSLWRERYDLLSSAEAKAAKAPSFEE